MKVFAIVHDGRGSKISGTKKEKEKEKTAQNVSIKIKEQKKKTTIDDGRKEASTETETKTERGKKISSPCCSCSLMLLMPVCVCVFACALSSVADPAERRKVEAGPHRIAGLRLWFAVLHCLPTRKKHALESFFKRPPRKK